MTIARVKDTSGAWIARGFEEYTDEPPTVPSTRDSLVYGTYKPSYDTVGVIAGTSLTPYNDPSVDSFTLPSSGGVVENKIIYGDVKPPSNGAYWEFKNCKFVGGNHVPSSASGVITAYGARTGSSATTFSNTGRIRLIDCTIEPRRPALNRDGIVGHCYTLERCLVTGGCIDCVGVFITTDRGTCSNVKIYGCILEKTGYCYPDYVNGISGATVHSDGTHNDLIQAQGGDNLEIIGNFLDGTSYGYILGSDPYPDYPWMVDQKINTGACVLLQNNTGAANYTVAKTKVTNNWLRGSKFQAVFHSGTGVVYTNNKHNVFVARRGPDAGLGSNFNGWHIWVSSPSDSNVVGVEGENTTNIAIDGPGANTPLIETVVSGGVSGLQWRTKDWPTGQ